jgi:hypothetical protein
MKFQKHLLMAAIVSSTLWFSGGDLKAQNPPHPEAPDVQWSAWAKPKVGGTEQGFSFRSSCTQADGQTATWVVEMQNDMSDAFALSSKRFQLGAVEAGQLVDVTIEAPNCKKQPEVTAVEQVTGDDQSLWYIYSFKDGKAKGKLHDANDPGWLGIVAAVAAGVAAAQQ